MERTKSASSFLDHRSAIASDSRDCKATDHKVPKSSGDDKRLARVCGVPLDEAEDYSSSVLSVPPDGGWGWVVVFASFMCNVIVDGIIFSFGILLLEISTTFQESKGRTAWIGSLQAGCYLGVGPLVSGMASKYGCRNVTIAGSVIASFGFLLAVWADSVLWLAVTFGVIGGVGFGFIYLPAIVTVGYYFEKKRAFATGIAVCGSGIGAFVMAPVTQLLIESYGWRGCVLILAGLILNCAVFGALFRPVPVCLDTRQSSVKRLLAKDEWEDSQTQDTISPAASENSEPPSYSAVIDAISSSRNRHSLDERSDFALLTKGKECTSQTSLASQGKKIFAQSLKSFLNEDVLYNELEKDTCDSHQECPPTEVSKCLPSPTLAHRNSSIPSATVSSVDNSAESEVSCCRQVLCSFDLTLLSSPSFLLLAFSGFLTLAGFFIPFMYIVDRAVLQGISQENGAYLLSVIGITNTVGRVFCGWISDRPQVNALLINNIALVVGGAVTLLSPLLFNTFFMLSVYGSIFGFSIACFAALRSVITVELLGLERLTSAFGLLLLPQGIATIIGAPFAGWLYDVSGSYDSSFYVSGSVIMASGIMCFFLPAVARWEQKRAVRRSCEA